jgi:hypothetical protein
MTVEVRYRYNDTGVIKVKVRVSESVTKTLAASR